VTLASSRRLLLPLVLSACCARPAAQKPAPEPPALPAVGDLGVQPANLDAQLTPYIEAIGGDRGEASRFHGYVLVAQHDQPIYARAFGLADRAASRAATADTTFRIGSVTKQFTAAAILKLEAAGKLSVNDTVATHLPSYPGPGKDVTIHQLLTHTAGLPNYTAMPAIEAKKNARLSTAELLALFQDLPLEFAPGSRFAYSNSGYAVLGAIIERVSGKRYAAYLRDELFAPAGMTRTAVDDAVGAPDRALGYKRAGEALVEADPIDLSVAFAAGAVRSTANDLVRWHRALAGDTILPATAREKLYRVERDGYAYGWVVQEVAGRHTVWHNGGIDGFRTMYWLVPDADLVVVVLGNVEEVNADPIGKAAVEAAFGATLEPPVSRKQGTLDPAIVARVVGTYAITDEGIAAVKQLGAPQELVDSIMTIEVTASSDGLSMKPNGQDAVNLTPVEGGAFFDEASGVELSFELPSAGPVTGVTLSQGPLRIRYSRRL